MDNRTGNGTLLKVCSSNSTDLIGDIEKRLTLAYPLILTVCLVSNTANLVIYQHKFFRSSPTIRMLAAKGVANVVSTISLFPNFLKSVPQWSKRRDINDIYWLGLPYMMFVANVFATFAIWLTVAVTMERYIMVAFPMHAKTLCTMRNATITIAVTFVVAVLLQMISLFARKLYIIPCFDEETMSKSYFYLYLAPKKYFKLQKANYYLLSTTTIVAPMVLMIWTTLVINYHLFWSSRRFSGSAVEQKRCVTRLSLSTTICHLIFEMPHFAVFIIAAVEKETMDFWIKWEVLTAAANFLSILNASVQFFVYLLCSKRYRLIAKRRLCCQSKATMDDGGTTNGHGGHTDETRLHPRRVRRSLSGDVGDNSTLLSSFVASNGKESPRSFVVKQRLNKRSYSCVECKTSSTNTCSPEKTSLLKARH